MPPKAACSNQSQLTVRQHSCLSHGKGPHSPTTYPSRFCLALKVNFKASSTTINTVPKEQQTGQGSFFFGRIGAEPLELAFCLDCCSSTTDKIQQNM
jgi:hypothetical protein